VGAASKLLNGTSEMNIPASGGNIVGNVAGSLLIFNLSTSGLEISGITSASGNVTGGNLRTGGLISATSTITSAANISGGNILTGGLISATSTITSAANISGGNILTGGVISATGNVNVGNLINAGSASSTGNITGGNLLTGGLISSTGTITGTSHLGAVVSVTGNVTGGNILNNGLISSTGNSTAGNYLTGGLISATGNVSGNYIFGNGACLTGVITSVANINNGTSNVTIATANANVTVSVGGTSNVAVFATTGEHVTGVVSASGNITGGNLLTGGLISATSTITSAANITGGNLLTGGLISATGNITGGNLSGTNLTGTLATAAQTNITSVGTLGSLAVTANVTGGNLVTGGIVSATGNVLGNVFTVNLGNTTTAIINGGGNAVGNIGSSSKYFNQVFAQATTALYADLAEIYSADAEYAPGTVVSFGGDNEVTKSVVEGDPRVAGVISEKPSYLMNSGLQAQHRAAVALTGRVPTLVIGPVAKGDMMVSAGNGWARASATPAMGTVIGKALVNFDGDSGIIEIVVGRM
jgi:filamentous hemagglutinin